MTFAATLVLRPFKGLEVPMSDPTATPDESMAGPPAKRRREIYEGFDYLTDGLTLSHRDKQNRKCWVPLEAVRSWDDLHKIIREYFGNDGQPIIYRTGLEVPAVAWPHCLKEGIEFQVGFAVNVDLHISFRRSKKAPLDLKVPTTLPIWRLRRQIYEKLKRERPSSSEQVKLVLNLERTDIDMDDLYDLDHYLFEWKTEQLFITAAWR